MEELPRYLVAEFPCLSFRGQYQISRCAYQVLVPPEKYECSFVSYPCQLMSSAFYKLCQYKECEVVPHYSFDCLSIVSL